MLNWALNRKFMQVLDEFDKQLLRLLQQNNQLSTADLSKKINLSQSAIHRRLSRLRKEKIIEADISIISAAVAGAAITCIVDVILHEGSSKSIDKFKQSMRHCTEVAHCYYVTGNYDFVLIVNTRDMPHFEAFSKKYLMDNPNLKHFYTHVVMDKVKVGYGSVI
jgi:Lrp/AsnC family transcriptional regulator, leucine-responsive regulatory protein